jgi:hypothetical protein
VEPKPLGCGPTRRQIFSPMPGGVRIGKRPLSARFSLHQVQHFHPPNTPAFAAAFLMMAALSIVQGLFCADGGLLALGCNIFNLGVFPCFIA